METEEPRGIRCLAMFHTFAKTQRKPPASHRPRRSSGREAEAARVGKLKRKSLPLPGSPSATSNTVPSKAAVLQSYHSAFGVFGSIEW